MRSHAEIVQAAYQALLHRSPDPAGRSQLTAALDEGMGLDAFFEAFLNSPEYVGRHTNRAALFTRFKPACTLLEDRLRLWIDMADSMVSMSCLAGDYEPSETRFVLDALSPGDVFLDIGANVGWFSIQAAERVGPTGHVHAFEPNDLTRSLLDRSVTDNGFRDRCTVHGVALGADQRDGRLIWHEGGDNRGGVRLAGDETGDAAGVIEQTVHVTTLDSLELAGPVKLIKIDVEGAEGLVLDGARGLIARDRPLMLIEMFDHLLKVVSRTDAAGLARLIDDLGYRIHRLEEGRIGAPVADPGALGADGPVNVILAPL